MWEVIENIYIRLQIIKQTVWFVFSQAIESLEKLLDNAGLAPLVIYPSIQIQFKQQRSDKYNFHLLGNWINNP